MHGSVQKWYYMRNRFLTHIVTSLAVLAWRVGLLGPQVVAGMSQAVLRRNRVAIVLSEGLPV